MTRAIDLDDAPRLRLHISAFTAPERHMLMRILGLVAALAAPAASAIGAPADDRQDFAFAERGFVATREDPRILAADGRLVWDLSAYSFLKGDAPATVNPSLWRQSQLLSKAGLFEVTRGVWQVRGFDISNVTFIAGKSGWIVIDPLTSTETAKAALDLANEHLGARPVVALLYTHSHIDHFGGARGMVSQADVDAGRVQVVAPAGFLEHAVSENLIAGSAMQRRAAFQFGWALPKGPNGLVSSGIGLAISNGTSSLIPPTIDVTQTGQTFTIDGVRIEFQLTPNSEAPSEMNFYLPDHKVLDLAENANASLHNVLTPRGALVRDAKEWASYLTESIRLYGHRSDILMTSHAWPRFGRPQIIDHLEKHRDAYKYLHDQSVRMMNDGLLPNEIANRLVLPPALAREWYNRDYYGTLSFNARAVYQRYMGWYDGNPVHLAALEPADEARRYVGLMGGPEKVLTAAQSAYDAGDDRWAGELLNRLVYADAGNMPARRLLARTYGRQAAKAESAVWRNIYLTAAQELRQIEPTAAGAGASLSLDLIRNTPTPLLLDLLAVNVDPAKAAGAQIVVDVEFADRAERHRLRLRHDVLVHEANPSPGPVDGAYRLPRADFLGAALGGVDVGASATAGDRTALNRLLAVLSTPRANFPIVTR